MGAKKEEKPKKVNTNRRWVNKETGKVIKVRPYWECPDPDKELSEMMEDGVGFKPIQYGTLYQAGWLLFNGSVYFVMAMNVKDAFKDEGEWKEEYDAELEFVDP